MGRRRSITATQWQRGLTLIEMLVTIGVLALVSAIVVLNAPARRSPSQIAAERLAARLHFAIENAVISGSPIELELSQQGYAFYTYTEGKWVLSENKYLGPENFRLPVTVDFEEADPTYRNEKFLNTSLLEDDENVHRLMIDPMGPQTPLIVTIGGVNAFSIILESSGGIQVRPQ